MEYIKQFIITLVTTIIFITAVDLIAPNKQMKKYIQFVTSLILVAVMVNPIVKLFTKGEGEVVNAIQQYENYFSEKIESGKSVSSDGQESAFKENLNKNCIKMLEDKFNDKKFTSDIQCTFDMKDMTYSIDKVVIGVKDNSVKLVDKIKIDLGSSKETFGDEDEVESEDEIVNYLVSVLNVSKDKIEIYNSEG